MTPLLFLTNTKVHSIYFPRSNLNFKKTLLCLNKRWRIHTGSSQKYWAEVRNRSQGRRSIPRSPGLHSGSSGKQQPAFQTALFCCYINTVYMQAELGGVAILLLWQVRRSGAAKKGNFNFTQAKIIHVRRSRNWLADNCRASHRIVVEFLI